MNHFFMAQSFSNQVLILLKKIFGKEIQILLDRQPKRVHAITVNPSLINDLKERIRVLVTGFTLVSTRE